MIKSKEIQRRRLVLVVDDQEINRDVMEVILEDHYSMIFAENGKECLELMEKHIHDLSIVLLDLMMPVMSGLDVLMTVKDDERLNKIPIIVMTADESAELEALQLGAKDFITKPFTGMNEIIFARIGRIIELSEDRNLIEAAERDVLTGLYSRNFFIEYANRLYSYHPEMHLDAGVINIEQFHSINALNGRDFGDEVLKAVGHGIESLMSETEGIASRLEADQFAIYCVQQPDYRVLLDRLQERVSRLSPNAHIHLRMGVKPWVEGVEPVLMFDNARTACNMVRGNYQNPLKIYNDEIRMKELYNQRLLNDLRAAVDEHQLIVYYQPKYNIQCTPPRLTSAEALIRWKHPELGMISPGAFVPLLEGKGMIGIIDRFVWEESARQVAIWRDKYGFILPVSVNLSRSDVFDPNLIQRLVDLIKDNRLNFRDLKLEVTESACTDDARVVLEVIENLRQLGFEIEMDDFGSGYSSLNMLSDMPVDVLKMDMKFIRNLETNATDRRLVELILDLASYLGLKVVAEGVETEGQLQILRDAACDIVQGYYFSRPLPPEEFEKLIEEEIAIERN